MNVTRTMSRTGLAACAAILAATSCAREPTTPEARRQRGDDIVRRMSDHLAAARTFTVEASDSRQRARGGQQVTVRTTRQFIVQRPNRIALRVTGDMDLKGWYDGQKVTLVSDSEKVWARVNGAPTIDETLDRMAERLGMPMPIADFLYSSAYDALVGTASTGGYVGRETVEGVATLHLAYQHPGVDFDLWVAEKGDPLPVKYRVTDKTLTPPRTFDVVFTSWQLAATVADGTFTPQVPAGYERIPLVVQAEEPATEP